MNMNSVIRISKSSVFCRHAVRFSELKLKLPFNCIQNFCSRTTDDFKFCSDRSTEKLDDMNTEDSDCFGTLKKSLESSSKFKYKQSAGVPKRKKIIVKYPKQDESDVFGNLSEKSPIWYPDMHEKLKEDNDISDDSVTIKNISKRYRRPEVYLHHMKCLVKEKKIKEALDLFVDMRRNFVTPERHHYTFMIGACGRVGYTEMAFKLFRQMTDRAYKPTPATFTGLFNSCAESPFPEYGLKKAKLLKEKIEIKNWELTQITYHAMIKAFGKCGDMATAFEIVDEMAKNEIKINASTYNFLLMSCISNKVAGFTYAVEVWRKMKARKCKPDIFTCNLLLKAAKDCDIGPSEISNLLLQHWSSYTKRPYGFLTKESMMKEQKPILKLKSGEEDIVSENSAEDSKTLSIQKHSNIENYSINTETMKLNESHNKEQSKYELQNTVNSNSIIQSSGPLGTSVIGARPVNGPEILELVNIKTPSDRLSLIGGMEGFLKTIFDAKVSPDIKTLTLLLECLPPSTKDEEELILIIDSLQIKPDIDFFNMLIKRRNKRNEHEAARSVLSLVNKHELTPDIITFGVLAMGCRTLKQASVFINEMDKFGITPNIEILGALLTRAIFIMDFQYMKYVLKLMEQNEIKPNERILSKLEKTITTVRQYIILKEQGKEVPHLYQQKNLSFDFKKFREFYEKWLKQMPVEIEEHPWLQYKTDIIDRAEREVME